VASENNQNLSEIGVFSFFVAVASIIATVVYNMLKDNNWVEVNPTNSSMVVKVNTTKAELVQIQNEYAFIAVFSLFMAMSFALGYVYAKNKNRDTRMDKIANEFLDAFLALSVSIVMARYLFDEPREFVKNLPYVIILFGLVFFIFMYSIYRAEGEQPILGSRRNLPPHYWEYLAMAVGILVLFVVWCVKSGICTWQVAFLAVILVVIIVSIRVQSKNGLLAGITLAVGYCTLVCSKKVSLIPGFILLVFIKLLLDSIFTEDSQNKVEDMKRTKRTKRNKSALSFIWKRLNMRPAKRTLKKRRRIKW